MHGTGVKISDFVPLKLLKCTPFLKANKTRCVYDVFWLHVADIQPVK